MTDSGPETPLPPTPRCDEQTSQHTDALVRASRIIFSNRDPARLPEMIVEVAVDVMKADAVTLFLPGVDDELYIACARGLPPAVQRSTRVTIGEGIAGRIAESRAPTICNGEVSRRPDAGGLPVRSSIVYPLTAAEALVGLLTFNRTIGRAPYAPADLGVASVLASQIVLALENARFAAQHAASERLAAVGLLAAGIAHEINTPLQLVGDSVHLLRGAFADLSALLGRDAELAARAAAAGAPALLDEIPPALDRAAVGLSRVVEIVRAVQQFGRPNAAARTRCDVNRELEATLIVARAEYNDVARVARDLGDVPPVKGHAGELGQVFLNLLLNAAHAVANARRPGGDLGTIAIRTRRDEDGGVVVTVGDDGCGIPEAARARIFDPFFTTREVGGGTGLGLSIARSIVERHAGTIGFETEVGRGTTFTVRLPAA